MNVYPSPFHSAVDRSLPALSTWSIVAAMLSGFAAAIHLWVVPEHLAEWWGYGMFFLVLAAAQALYALVILRSQRPVLVVTGIVGTVAILALYAWSRVVAVPLGPMAGDVEEVGWLDTVCTIAEVTLAVVLLVLLVRALMAR